MWGPRRCLPGAARLRHLAGESTGSFVNRLAHFHGLDLGSFLDRVGEGRQPVNPRLPQLAEVYVNRTALSHLAVQAGRSRQQLQRALPHLAERFLLSGDGEGRWAWPFEPYEGHLVRCCDLCALARGAEETAWLVWPDSWRVCLRHLRFTDDSRGEGPEVVRLEGLPEVVRAHRERQRMERRFGAAGAGLFADAFQVVVRWWTRTPDVWCWRQRASAAGVEVRVLRAAPLVIGPEAMKLAWEMLGFEQCGGRGHTERARWLKRVQQLVDGWGLDAEEGWSELVQWLERHSQAAPVAFAPPQGRRRRRYRVLAVGHNRIAEHAGSLVKRSCLH
ncbi:TniQ family protein [Streptomyces sp. NPDC028722]|uniref:TniQ family protein n=1 Tax=Streptomyces sp. NPDC028722 TaxID=3155016 RepID=UPI0033FA7AB6